MYYYITNILNFHLQSQTNKASLNGDVVLPSIGNNHITQKSLLDMKNIDVDYLVESTKDISLYYSLFLKFLYTETQANEFTSTKTNPKQIRAEVLQNRIQIQSRWTEELNPNRSIDEIKYNSFIKSNVPRRDFYNPALEYFLSSFTESDFEIILMENLEYIQNELESFNYSGNIENYQKICLILQIPYLGKAEERVLSIITKYIENISKPVQTVKLETEPVQEIKFDVNNLPDYFSIDSTSIEDYNKNELFHDADREYIAKVIQIMIDTKVNEKDDVLFKFLYLKKCLENPAENNLPPKKIKKLNKAQNVIGMSTIPLTHFRIRVNQRARMIVGLDKIGNKINLIITDDHDLLK
jgi:hypothetical protein